MTISSYLYSTNDILLFIMQNYITCCAIQDYTVVTGSADNTLRVWHIESGQCIAILEGHQSFVNHVICKGKFIFSTSYDNTARVWCTYRQQFCVHVLNASHLFCMNNLNLMRFIHFRVITKASLN